jgi:hypothetical protein
MINNVKVATPQSGISYADIIYETLAEGGLTRMMALYQDISVVDTIGSVRSARPYYIELSQAYDAIYIHAGGSDAAYSDLINRSITHIDGVNGTAETFYRDAWRRANMGYEHSLMLNTTLLDDYIAKYKLRTDHKDGYESNMVFTDEPLSSDSAASTIKVKFSSSKSTTLDYDAESGLYTISQYGAAMTDNESDGNVTVKNVIVISTSISKISGDSAGRLSVTLTGSGKGYMMRDGQCVEITWSKDSYSSQFTYTLADGSTVEFGRGSTYIAIIPTSGGSVSWS